MVLDVVIGALRTATQAGPSANWRWFTAACGVAMIGYGYYEQWREGKKGEGI
jgi:hypothetical protein